MIMRKKAVDSRKNAAADTFVCGGVRLHMKLRKLFTFEGQKRSDAGALDCLGKFPLVLCAGTAHAAGQHFARFGYELFKAVYILIVDNFNLFLAEDANLSARCSFIALFNGFFFHF